MTQVFDENGTVTPVTQVKVGPCVITQVKTTDTKDGYNAVQVGFDKKKKMTKAQKGHLGDLVDFNKYIKEFRLDNSGEFKRGDKITADTFSTGDLVTVVGTSKGKGYQGVVRRHAFSGSPATHGHKDQLRKSGSIGAGGVQRVFPGLRMAGHMGDEQVTVKNLKIVKVDSQEGILYIKGAVPGARNGLLTIKGEGDLKVNMDKQPDVLNDANGGSNLQTQETGDKQDSKPEEPKEENK